MAETPSVSVNLKALAEELLNKAAGTESGRATHVFRAVPGDSLLQVLLVLKDGKELSKHENPGEALLHVLSGKVRLTADDDSLELSADEHAVVPQ